MSQFLKEVLEQPDTLRLLLDQGRKPVQITATRIQKFAPEWVMIVARGSSDNAARYAQYLFGAHNQLGVALALPSLVSLYHAPPRMQRALVIGISQSGQSPDIVAVIEEARHQGGLTLAVTNDLESPLARAASQTLPLCAGVESGIAATKTYSAELVVLAMLSAAIEGDADRVAVLERVPDYVQEVIASVESQVAQAASNLANSARLMVLGRGFNYSTAFEIALKVEELCYIGAESFSFADLMHGPVALIDRELPVMLVAPSGSTLVDVPALTTLLAQRGACTVAISDRAEVLERANHRLKLPCNVPEWISPMLAVIVGQLFAHALCLASGHDPDKPRGLSKVTLTR